MSSKVAALTALTILSGCAPLASLQPLATLTAHAVAALPAAPPGTPGSAGAPSGGAAAGAVPAAALGSGSCGAVEVAPGRRVALSCAALPELARAAAPLAPSARRPLAGLPVAVDLRAQGLDGPVLDQAQVGVCWTFALSNVMTNSLRRQNVADVVAPLHILASDTWTQLHQSARTREYLSSDRDFPYDPTRACQLNESQTEVWCGEAYGVTPGSWRRDPRLVRELEQARALGKYNVEGMQQLALPAEPEQVAETLAQGKVIYVGFDIDSEAWGYRSVQGGVVPDWAARQAGHAVTLVGYRPALGGRQYLLHNSWGTDWGERGYAWVSEAMLRLHAKQLLTVDAGLKAGVTPTSLPAERPAPTASDCSVRDLLFGTCTQACPSGTAPVAGVCLAQLPQCAAGQALDVATGQCASRCANGLPPFAGLCAPW